MHRTVLATAERDRMGFCRSEDCNRPRRAGGLYCSGRCVERERKRRSRYRKRLRETRDQCVTCGTVHHPDGRLTLR